MADLFKLCEEKLGFVPNVFKAFSFDMAKLEAFVAYRNVLMQGESGLSKLEREMIATAVSTQNRCYYCVTSHGSAVRGLSGDPILGEQIVMNYRAADLDKRQRAMLDFAVKLTVEPWTVEESDREGLRKVGFSDRDIWDIAAIAAFFNMTNRLASAIDMRPNSQYHAMATVRIITNGTTFPGSRCARPGNDRQYAPTGLNAHRLHSEMTRLAFVLLFFVALVLRHVCRRRRGHRPPRHGGGAGGARRQDRRRVSGEGRQCGRRRGRDRLCAGGDLSARRQYRRRRLHGDPSRARRTGRSRSTTARPRRRRRRRDIFLDEKGDADPRKSRDSALSIGVPGTVAGLALAHQRFGSGLFSLADLIAPAIKLARDGIPIEDDVADSLPRAQTRLARWPASAKIFLKSDGSALAPGDTLVQTRSRRYARSDRARRPARLLRRRRSPRSSPPRSQAAGGIMTRDDLKDYRPIGCAGRCAAPIAATPSCRCRRRRPAAWC